MVAPKIGMPEAKRTMGQALWQSKSTGHIGATSSESEDELGPNDGNVPGLALTIISNRTACWSSFTLYCYAI